MLPYVYEYWLSEPLPYGFQRQKSPTDCRKLWYLSPSSHPKLPTYRPRGRLDYQIIYITAGCGHFHFDNVDDETIVPAGNIVLYRPKELQKYEYYGEDKTEVYWIHFTGSNVKNILRQYGFSDKERVFQVGTSMEYERVFKRIIIELQRCQDNYEEMLVLLLRHLLITFHRELTREHILKNEYLDQEMNTAVTYFSEIIIRTST